MFGNSNTAGSSWTTPQSNQQGTSAFGSTTFGNTGNPAFGTGSAFGQPQQQQPQANPMFGGLATPATNTTNSAFGAFGTTPAQNNTSSLFGAKPNTTGFGVFGGGGTTAYGGTSFGQPSSGGATTGTGNVFGQTNTSGAFGTTSGSSLFGAKPATNTFGAGLAPTPPTSASYDGVAPVTTGTANPPYQTFNEKESATSAVTLQYQAISCMPPYRGSSFEELRVQDYAQGRKTASASPFGQSNTFGTTQPTASSGIFGATQNTAQPPNSIFGSSTTPAANAFSAFGQTQATATGTSPAGAFNAFGQAQQPTQPATGFGLFGQNNAQPQPQQSTSIFGNNASKPGFGAFGSTPALGSTTGAFGQPQQQQATTSTGIFGQPAQSTQTNAFGGFGANANNVAKPSIFGTTNQPGAPTTAGFGLFGNNQQQQPAAGQQTQPATSGLFGGGNVFGSQPGQQPQQQQPAATNIFGNNATGGGLFGNNHTGGLFGTQPQQNQATAQPGTGLFGTKPATPVGQTNPFGTFGQPATTAAPAQQPGLFGNTLGQSAAQPMNNTGFGGSIFGAKPAAPVAGSSYPLGGAGSGLFGNTLGQPTPLGNSTTTPGATLTASISQPIGTNLPIFSMLPPGPRAIPLDSQPKKKSSFFVDVPTRSPVPRIQLGYTPANTKLRGFGASASASTLGGGPGNSLSFSAGKPNALSFSKSVDPRSSVGPDSLLGGNSSPSLGSGSRQSVKKLVLDKKVAPSDLFNKSGGSPGPLRSGSKVTFNPALSVAAREKEAADAAASLAGNKRAQSPARNQQSKTPGKFTAHSTNHVLNSSRESPEKDLESEELKEGDYWVKPDMKTLRQKGFDELQAFEGLVVGRVGYGEVQFLEPVDLTGVRKLSQLFGEIVRFDDKECSVYPDSDDVDKPPPGSGLNVKAKIVLLRCWASDKATREPITDEAHPQAVKHLKRLKNMKDTKFEGFEMEEGKWTFTVEHF